MGENIRRWYDEKASRWRLHYEGGNRHFLQRIRNVQELVHPLSHGQTFLDAGCGTGEISASLAGRFGCHGVGIDISEQMIKQCFAQSVDNRLEFRVADIQTEDFQEMKFDLIVSLSLLEWIEDIEGMVRRFSSILKANGQLIVSLPNWRSLLRKLELLSAKVRKSSYVHMQKNRISIKDFLNISASYGFSCERALYHVVPLYSRNLGGVLGEMFGMMCMLSMTKVQPS